MDNREDSSAQSDAAENTVDGTWLESRFSNIASTEGDVTKEEHLGAGSDKKALRNRFHLFHHKQKKPGLSTDAPSSSRARDITEAPKQSAHSHGVTSENRISQLQDEQALAELTELLINPSKVLQTNGNAVVNVPPAQAPEGHAARRPIHPRGGTGNEETDGEKGVEASKACFTARGYLSGLFSSSAAPILVATAFSYVYVAAAHWKRLALLGSEKNRFCSDQHTPRLFHSIQKSAPGPRPL
ncbi:hypothetical protein EMCRGX_G022298 [Ephydatia muelleri]